MSDQGSEEDVPKQAMAEQSAEPLPAIPPASPQAAVVVPDLLTRSQMIDLLNGDWERRVLHDSFQSGFADPLHHNVKAFHDCTHWWGSIQGRLPDWLKDLNTTLHDFEYDACLAYIQHTAVSEDIVKEVSIPVKKKILFALQELCCHVYYGLAQKAAEAKFVVPEFYAPMVLFERVPPGERPKSPYTFDIAALYEVLRVVIGMVRRKPGAAQKVEELQDMKATCVAFPPDTAESHGLFEWTTMGHEVAGHDFFALYPGLRDQMSTAAEKACGLRSVKFQRYLKKSPMITEEFACDILGALTLGPAFPYCFMKTLRTLRGGELLNFHIYRDVHPTDVFRMIVLHEAIGKLRIERKARKAFQKFLTEEIKQDLDGGDVVYYGSRSQRVSEISRFRAGSRNVRCFTLPQAKKIARDIVDAILGTPFTAINENLDPDVEPRTFSHLTFWNDIDEEMSTDLEFMLVIPWSDENMKVAFKRWMDRTQGWQQHWMARHVVSAAVNVFLKFEKLLGLATEVPAAKNNLCKILFENMVRMLGYVGKKHRLNPRLGHRPTEVDDIAMLGSDLSVSSAVSPVLVAQEAERESPLTAEFLEKIAGMAPNRMSLVATPELEEEGEAEVDDEEGILVDEVLRQHLQFRPVLFRQVGPKPNPPLGDEEEAD